MEDKKPSSLLLVDVDESLLSALSKALRRKGVSVVVARSSDEAVRELSRGNVRSILTGVNMDKECGVQFHREQHKQFPGVVWVAMTGGCTAEQRRYFENAGVRIIDKSIIDLPVLMQALNLL